MLKNLKKLLETAYDADAERRGASDFREGWKLEQRENFAKLAKQKSKKTLLEIGAGDGFDSLYFQNQGFAVLATDLSSKMVAQCQKRGVKAEVADIYDLGVLGKTFDAVYSMNVLLHVPLVDLQDVLKSVHSVLNKDGIFILGNYGGIQREEVTTDPNMMNLPRFFSFVSDETLRQIAGAVFDEVSFETVRPSSWSFDVGGKEPGFHFQALVLRKS